MFTLNFNGEVALVTGASRGIGRQIAIEFAKSQAKVICVATHIDKLKDTVRVITEQDGQAFSYVCDVSNSEQVNKLVEQIINEHGKIDILVNNAGIIRDSILLRMKDTDWDAVINVNLKGTFLFTKAVSKYMIKNKKGRIINISSISGIKGNPGQANYSASKAGLIGFTRTVACELASRNITVNAVAPGFIYTDMIAGLREDVRKNLISKTPLGRMGSVEDVANAVLFLASDKAGFITGHTLVVDGGFTL